MANPAFQFPDSHLHRKPLLPQLHNPSFLDAQASYSHSRTRTTSSNAFPIHNQSQPAYANNMPVNQYASRRTPSNATFSTFASSGNGPVPVRQSSTDLRRSTSSRSGGSVAPSGYVSLMRKQKATVWCDRSQHEDPRLVAAQKAAKMRAAMEVVGRSNGPTTGGRSSTSAGSIVGSNKVTAKIRHHGKAGLVGYSPGDLVGGVGGVPMRLSATEVEGEDSDDDSNRNSVYNYNHRTGSARSSQGSARSARSAKRGVSYGRQSGASSTGRWSHGNTPPNEKDRNGSTTNSIAELAEEKPQHNGQGDLHRSASDTSGSSGERADGLAELDRGEAARLASNSLLKSTLSREKSTRNPDELRRRGSVDERTMTMSAGRLYVANPDADSD